MSGSFDLSSVPDMKAACMNTGFPAAMDDVPEPVTVSFHFPKRRVQRHRQPATAESKLADYVSDEQSLYTFGEKVAQNPSEFGPIRPIIMRRKREAPPLGNKRGPKERQIFERFIYCLPDIQSYLPSFTSNTERDTHLKNEYQLKGYGYPARDYNNGYPRPTPIVINHSVDEFQAFLTRLYPVLEGRELRVYKMNRQKRLLLVSTSAPREIRESNYKGIIVVIPTMEGQSSSVSSTGIVDDDELVHRVPSNNHLKYSMVSDPRQHPPGSMSQGHVLTSGIHVDNMLPSRIDVDSMVPSRIDVDSMVPSRIPVRSVVQSGMRVDTVVQPPGTEHLRPSGTISSSDTPVSIPSIRVKEEPKERGEPVETPKPSHPDDEGDRIKSLAISNKTTLESAHTLHVTRETLVDDIIGWYQNHPSFARADVSIVVEKPGTGSSEEADTNSVFTEFWRRAYKIYFAGESEMVPTLSPMQCRDVFLVLGRVLAHGLALLNYWPLKLSRSCAFTVMTNRDPSENLVWESFERTWSATERKVIVDLEKKAERGEGYDSPADMALVSQALSRYGCTEPPPAEKLKPFLNEMAVQHFHCRPYWALLQMHKGFTNSSNASFANVTEEDVSQFYDNLTVTATSVNECISYTFSEDPRHQSFEMSASSLMEQLIRKLSPADLRRLLLLWCGSDCLSADTLFVTFSQSSKVCPPTFQRSTCQMSLCRYFSSVTSMHQQLEVCFDEGVSLKA